MARFADQGRAVDRMSWCFVSRWRWGVTFSLLGCVTLTTLSLANDEAPPSTPPEGWERPKLNAGGEAPFRHEINLYDYDGVMIDPKTSTEPYSPAVTCGKCHDVEAIACGSHFNVGRPDNADGRNGEPWWWTDSQTQTQVPVSARDWSNAHSPETLGLTPWSMTLQFGGYTTGGGLGDPTDPEDDPSGRWKISGTLAADCLVCHLASREYDHPAWVQQIERQNLKWAATAAGGFASVKGSAKNLPDDYDPEFDMFGENENLPVVTYDAQRFDAAKRIFLEIVSRVPNDNCYRCHSQEHVGIGAAPAWQYDEDVHVARGISCVDCHRHGIDHRMIRGDLHDPLMANHPSMATMSCVGCHYGHETEDGQHFPGGNFGAPRPKHVGLPPLHLEEMSCTACHSGPRPSATTLQTQTAMAHQLGQSSSYRTSLTMPHLVSLVFATNEHGEIAPYRAGWPAFWGRRNAEKPEEITPLTVEVLESKVAPLLPKPKHAEDWRPLTKDEITNVLTELGDDAVYVAGGLVHSLEDGALVSSSDDSVAAPSLWPIGHNVRPAADSLGVSGCTECHANDAIIDVGLTADARWPQLSTDIPTLAAVEMRTLREHDATLVSLWNTAFQGRDLYKVIAWVALGIAVFVTLAAALATAMRLLIRFSCEREARS